MPGCVEVCGLIFSDSFVSVNFRCMGDLHSLSQLVNARRLNAKDDHAPTA